MSGLVLYTDISTTKCGVLEGMICSTDTTARTRQTLMGIHVQDGAPTANPRAFSANSVAEHDCDINEFAHGAPGAILGGGATVVERILGGAGSAVEEGVTMRSRATVELGSLVIRDVADRQTIVRVPARGTDAN